MRKLRALPLLTLAAFVILLLLGFNEPPVCGQSASRTIYKERDASGICFNGNEATCGIPLR